MIKHFVALGWKKYKEDNVGAVTVDWVVLTAGVVVLSGVVLSNLALPVELMGSVISSAIADPLGS